MRELIERLFSPGHFKLIQRKGTDCGFKVRPPYLW